MSCNRSKRRWRPTGATSTPLSTANEAVTVPHAVRRPDEELVPGRVEFQSCEGGIRENRARPEPLAWGGAGGRELPETSRTRARRASGGPEGQPCRVGACTRSAEPGRPPGGAGQGPDSGAHADPVRAYDGLPFRVHAWVGHRHGQ